MVVIVDLGFWRRGVLCLAAAQVAGLVVAVSDRRRSVMTLNTTDQAVVPTNAWVPLAASPADKNSQDF